MVKKYNRGTTATLFIACICYIFISSCFSFHIADSFDWRAFGIIFSFSIICSCIEEPILTYLVENNKRIKTCRLTLYETLLRIEKENKWEEYKTFSYKDSRLHCFRYSFHLYKHGIKRNHERSLSMREFRKLYDENTIISFVRNSKEISISAKRKILKVLSEKDEPYFYQKLFVNFKENKILKESGSVFKNGISLSIAIVSLILAILAIIKLDVNNFERAYFGLGLVTIFNLGSFYFRYNDLLDLTRDALVDDINHIYYFLGEKVTDHDIDMYYKFNELDYEQCPDILYEINHNSKKKH